MYTGKRTIRIAKRNPTTAPIGIAAFTPELSF
jgi:hypothetical protein